MRRVTIVFLGVVLASTALPAFAGSLTPSNAEPPVISWQPPPTWTPGASGPKAFSRAGFSGTALTDISSPIPFVAIAACRQYDSRSSSTLANNTARAVTLSGAPCGIPTGAQAVAVNITVFSITGAIGNGVFKVDNVSPPAQAWINYPSTETQRGNAGVVPVAASAVLYVQVNQGAGSVHFAVDVFGYYAGASASGEGMNLTASSGNVLTLNLTGSGDGLHILATTTGYSLWSHNYATGCGGICGGRFGVDSTAPGAIALSGDAFAGASRNVGVRGFSAGSGTGGTIDTVAAGVLGLATNMGNVFAHGVAGQTASTSPTAAGVYGEATEGNANGGFFQNRFGTGVYTILSYWGVSSAVGIATNGRIYGSNGLQISGLPKSFVTPHPEDPSREIVYVAAEGPTSDVFFRGTAQLRNGTAVIPVPDHFRLVAREDSYMTTVTSVGSNGGLFVETEGPEGIVVRGSGDARFHYVVWGERDECKNHEAVQSNTHFTPDAMEKTGALKTFPEPTRALLVKNGTLNPDGTYNRTTARRLGWNIPEPPPESVAAPTDTRDAKKK